MSDANAVHSESTNVVVEAVGAVAVASAVGRVARISAAIPLEWMVRGYVKAVCRFDEAAVASSDDARDVSIALFEASNWIASLSDRVEMISDDGVVQGLRFHAIARITTSRQPSTSMLLPALGRGIPNRTCRSRQRRSVATKSGSRSTRSISRRSPCVMSSSTSSGSSSR
jgi:hypothetical protein